MQTQVEVQLTVRLRHLKIVAGTVADIGYMFFGAIHQHQYRHLDRGASARQFRLYTHDINDVKDLKTARY